MTVGDPTKAPAAASSSSSSFRHYVVNNQKWNTKPLCLLLLLLSIAATSEVSSAGGNNLQQQCFTSNNDDNRKDNDDTPFSSSSDSAIQRQRNKFEEEALNHSSSSSSSSSTSCPMMTSMTTTTTATTRTNHLSPPHAANNARQENNQGDDQEHYHRHHHSATAEELYRLHRMTFQIEGESSSSEKVYSWVYIEPDVSSFYHQEHQEESNGSNVIEKVTPYWKGRICKFVNLGPNDVLLYIQKQKTKHNHQAADDDLPFLFVKTVASMHGSGFSTFAGRHFSAVDRVQRQVVMRFQVAASDAASLVTYDPRQQHQQQQTDAVYRQWKKTLSYAAQYAAVTGRAFLSQYGRARPKHFIWPANKLGQQHVVVSRETHFVQMPAAEHLKSVLDDDWYYDSSDTVNSSNVRLREYRQQDADHLTLTLTVLSCAPRILEIQNFLSPVEVQHLLNLGHRKTLQHSGTGNRNQTAEPDNLIGGSGSGSKTAASSSSKHNTRTSENAWIFRHESAVVDAVYRRAADAMRIDESQFRDKRKPSQQQQQQHQSKEQRLLSKSVAEPLQLVHYTAGQEYKAHYDFGFPDADAPMQPTRFATLLIYLNGGDHDSIDSHKNKSRSSDSTLSSSSSEPQPLTQQQHLVGGATWFPRYSNAVTDAGLQVKPAAGKAVLFYNMLPDGNMDVLSQHAALPVLAGEKYLANLWVWDPVLDLSNLK